ncbi:DUF4296 domain-containing protein [Psychroserpens damuponensis]|uniref:DUF4296 domain-containing protein n=1 Tax=Psychroserpens damuponensis TaxID=943936 RepID=UPI000694F6DF|nr:DUF4296 domain-containing protein [Psychroserpens damuponensis]
MKYQSLVLFIIVVVLLSCSDKRPKPEDLISEEKMVDVIYEASILTNAKGVNKKLLEDNGIQPEQFVFSKYNIDSLQFVNSLNYYASSIETYDLIYTKVDNRINLEKERIEALIEKQVKEKKENKERKSNKDKIVTERGQLKSNTVDTFNVDLEVFKYEDVGLKVFETDEKYREKNVFKLTRKSTINPAYLSVNNDKTSKGESVEATIYVKKTKDNSAFGFRISGIYPNRVDALFNLKDGTLKAVKSTGLFTNETASIKLVDKEWYECKIRVKTKVDKVRIVLGPTDIDKLVKVWESKSDNLSHVYTTIPVLIRE